jgi:cytochrome c-type protein NapB
MKKIVFTMAMLFSLFVSTSAASSVTMTTVAAASAVEAQVETPNLTACTSCHGTAFERSAMGKSRIVKDLNSSEIYDALKGYQDGTYGGSMKSLMKGQVARYSD